VADLQAFIGQWNGRYAQWAHGYGGQCVDIVELWLQANGRPTFGGNAIDVASQRWSGATWTPNCPSCVPSAGDIVVWGSGVGADGHVAVFIGGDSGSFNSFDQNWPIGSTCHVQHHTYNAVLGWQALGLAAASGPQPPPIPPPPSQSPPPAPPAPAPSAPVAETLGVVVLAAAVAGALYWRERRPGEPVTLANVERDLLEGLRSGLRSAEDLAGGAAAALEDEVAHLRQLLPV
jgi:hypothetical protein